MEGRLKELTRRSFYMEWNPALYDKKHDFVAEYGKGLLEFVPKNNKQAILDLGCGTGVLTVQLAGWSSKVVGVDSSQSMIEKAKEQFGSIEFMVCDALALPFENEFDVVFSNAVFHWISDHDTLLKNVHKVLKPQGLLICEFGAKGNIAAIENAFIKACNDSGYHYKPKFNFPATEDFGKLLKSNDFVIDRIYDYDRPTVLKDEERGLANWMKQFYAAELAVMPEDAQITVCKKVEELTKGTLWNGEAWVADYRRLRAVAHLGKKTDEIDFIRTDGRNKDFIENCRLLDIDLDRRVGKKIKRDKYKKYNQSDEIQEANLFLC